MPSGAYLHFVKSIMSTLVTLLCNEEHFFLRIVLDVAISDFANAEDAKEALKRISRRLAANAGKFLVQIFVTKLNALFFVAVHLAIKLVKRQVNFS